MLCTNPTRIPHLRAHEESRRQHLDARHLPLSSASRRSTSCTNRICQSSKSNLSRSIQTCSKLSLALCRCARCPRRGGGARPPASVWGAFVSSWHHPPIHQWWHHTILHPLSTIHITATTALDHCITLHCTAVYTVQVYVHCTGIHCAALHTVCTALHTVEHCAPP